MRRMKNLKNLAAAAVMVALTGAAQGSLVLQANGLEVRSPNVTTGSVPEWRRRRGGSFEALTPRGPRRCQVLGRA